MEAPSLCRIPISIRPIGDQGDWLEMEDLFKYCPSSATGTQQQRFQKAVETYTSRIVPAQQVVHFQLPIRVNSQTTRSKKKSPQLQVSLAILGPDDETTEATLSLIRMVNGLPLIDSIEAAACGLVHGSTVPRIWNSFGLDLIPGDRSTPTKMIVRDSAQVTPFFRDGTHQQYDDSGLLPARVRTRGVIKSCKSVSRLCRIELGT